MSERMRVAKHSFFNQAILNLYLPLAGGVMDAGAIIDMSGGDIIDIDNITFGDGDLDMTPTATNRILLPISNLPGTPSLTLDGTNSGLFASAANTLRLALNGATNVTWEVGIMRGPAGSNYAIRTTTDPTLTVPVYCLTNTDLNTGLGWGGADILAGIAGAVTGWTLTEEVNRNEFRTYGSVVRKVTDVNATPYNVLQTDYYLQCRRTAGGILTVNLPSIAVVSTATSAFKIIIKDTGYNAAANNITVVRNGADLINNVAGNYTINVDGTCLVLKGNATTSDWEIC